MKFPEYSESLTNISRDQLLTQLKDQVSEKRYKHVLGVEEAALELAEANQVDLAEASLAALLHDFAKDMDPETMLGLALIYTGNERLKEGSPAIWHGPAAAQIGRDRFGITNPSILKAVAVHTIASPEMDSLAKVLYTADYIEAGRDFKGVATARKLAKKDLDQACLYQMAETIAHLAQERKAIYYESLDAYNAWCQKLNS
ncbi:bis(5'-nucleosyl)-tetraphosphatase (symmetrical) YqeK [Eremococcus coleocola]|uniref:bis(5'-nucleosyl)-tetraphosphatase (symmetrical) YqeK n=1 Tax=Eremococcus coleocola TaxID=88132 RepID=UPI0004228699|nr:bis(5'-nucleosyl)-tetraphosphatase (symmetrical) YqeK [Eremococcus coleocola]